MLPTNHKKQNKTKQNKTKQNKTKQNKNKQTNKQTNKQIEMDMLPTNLSATHEFSPHDELKIAPFTVWSGDVFSVFYNRSN